MESVLEILYEAYSESRMADSPSIRDDFAGYCIVM